MPGSAGDTLENAILDHILGGPDYTRLGTVYLAAFTVAPSDSGGGTEVTGGAYARVSIINNSTNFPGASGGAKSNGVEIQFPIATASWGTVVAVAIMSASTAGTILFWTTLAASKDIATNDQLVFPANDLDFTAD